MLHLLFQLFKPKMKKNKKKKIDTLSINPFSFSFFGFGSHVPWVSHTQCKIRNARFRVASKFQFEEERSGVIVFANFNRIADSVQLSSMIILEPESFSSA